MKKKIAGFIFIFAFAWLGRSMLINAQVAEDFSAYLPIVFSDESSGTATPTPMATATATLTATATPTESSGTATPTPTVTATPSDVGGLDTSLFFDGALAEDISIQDCTLSDGTQTTCYEITIAGSPANHGVGPFCPETTSDTASDVGIWFDGNGVYDLTGAFIPAIPEAKLRTALDPLGRRNFEVIIKRTKLAKGNTTG